ncbi:MAG: class I SAM-dependent methyltransferase [Chloroflexia bacterium]
MSELDLSELDYASFWNRAFAAADPSWRRIPMGERTNRIVDLLVARRARVVLDLGCAIGRLSMRIAAAGIEVYGIDISEKAIEFALAWARDEGMPNVHFQVGSASNLLFPDATFDAVVAIALLDHMPLAEAQRAVREVRAVLKPQGLFVASFDNPQGKEGHPYYAFPDGTRLYIRGPYRGLVWRPYTESEVRKLLVPFALHELKQESDGSLTVIAQKPGIAPGTSDDSLGAETGRTAETAAGNL